MPIEAVLVSSLSPLGIPQTLIQAPAMYLHFVERAILERKELSIPFKGVPYFDPLPVKSKDLIVKGVPWYPGEEAVLRGLLALIPRFSPDGESDPAYLIWKGGTIPIVPFAYPLKFERADGLCFQAPGMFDPNEGVIYTLRSSLLDDPLRFVTDIYHELWHVVQTERGGSADDFEREAHAKQLEMVSRMLQWVQSQLITSDALATELFLRALNELKFRHQMLAERVRRLGPPPQ